MIYSMEIDHNLGTHGAVQAAERACAHYERTYPQAGIVWRKPTSTDFEVTLSVAGISGTVRGRVLPDKILLSLDVPGNIKVPEQLVKIFVRREASKWLTG